MSQAEGTHSTRDLLARLLARTLEYDFTVWVWGDAIAIDGLLEAAALLGNDDATRWVTGFYRAWARRSLTWQDHLTPGLGLLRVYRQTRDEALLVAAQGLAQLLESAPHSPRFDAPMYRPDINVWRHNVWVDTMYHEPSFFCELAELTGDSRLTDVGLKIWDSHVRALSSPHGPFLAHSIDCGSRALKGYGWGRGQGWALYGMVDTLERLSPSHPQYTERLEQLRTRAEQIAILQDASGFWHTLIHDREAYLESSTAAFFGAAFTRAVRLGLLGAEYQSVIERAWRAVRSRIDHQGSFHGVSGFTHAGVSLDDAVSMYKTLPTETNVWGQGAALRFACERLLSGQEEWS